MLDTAYAKGVGLHPQETSGPMIAELWPELEEYILQCLDTPSDFMIHTTLGSFEVQVHLILEKHISYLTTKNGRVKPRF